MTHDAADRQMEEAPAFGASVRISASIEPEAAAMLEALAKRLYPERRISIARALIIEQAIRAMHRRVRGASAADEAGDAGDEKRN